MDGFSLNVVQEQINKLKELFPEVISEEKIDWERLRATLGEDTFISNERYVLNWAGKSDAFKTLQTGTTATLAPARDESINFDSTDNVFIEGENLEVLKVLQKAYFGKIKCIIIDPPYNTGNDSFIYPDKFSETKEEYMRRVGDKDEEGYLMKEGLFRKNSKENGQYHSNWLSMMYPRLFLARNLLRDDGVIFVHIDDNEVHNLRLLMNEIFGEENFLGEIVRTTGQTTGQDSGGLGNSFDFILGYTKHSEVDIGGLPLTPKDMKRFENEDEVGKFAYDQLRKTGSSDRREDRPNMFYPVRNPDGNDVYPIAPAGYEGRWRFEKKTYEEYLANDLILWKKTKRNNEEIWWPYVKYYLEGRTKRPSPLWDDLDGNKKASRDLRSLFDGNKIFDFPKPVQLAQRLIQITPNLEEYDIILDFFAGSGTTAHAVLELNKEDGGNRKFILVQLPEKTDENSEAYKAGYKTIVDISKERIRRVIKKIKEERKPSDQSKIIEDELPELDLGFKVFKLKPSNFKQWQSKVENPEDLQIAIDDFIDPVKPETEEENMLFELLLKSGYDFNSKIETKTIEASRYFVINTNELVLQLSGKPESVINDILTIKPKKVIMLDRLFENNDQLKTNTYLQFKDAGVDFRTV